ncbi:hypothetical protein MTO96_029720 [Rhipicephalus appendiculatus]
MGHDATVGMRLVTPFIYLVQLVAELSPSSAVHNELDARTHPAWTKLINDIDWHEAKVPFNPATTTLPHMPLPSQITSRERAIAPPRRRNGPEIGYKIGPRPPNSSWAR